MNRLAILLLIIMYLLAEVPRGMGQSYSGSVLYAVTDDVSAHVDPQVASGRQFVGQDFFTNHALLSTNTGSTVDLNPTGLGFTFSIAIGTNGAQQVGMGQGNGMPTSALLWSGTATSAVDLNPTNLSGISNSYAYSTSGNEQVGIGIGSGMPAGAEHALRWTGTAASAVDLNPAGITSSFAWGTDGMQQVGGGGDSATGHAFLWTGTATSAVDLNPTNLSGISDSVSYGNSAFQQVGSGGTASANGTALLWDGTAASAVNLGPGLARGTNGVVQVGESSGHARMWFGTAASAIDLQSLLPTGTWNSSTAYTVDSSGNVYGSARGTFNGVNGEYAIEWSPLSIPTPISWAVAAEGVWSNAPNWSAANVPDSIIGVSFNTGSATPYTTTLAVSSSANSITVQDHVTIQKAGFNLAVPSAVMISGNVGQRASLTLAGAGLSTFGSLAINNFGQLDITDNSVIINYGVGNPSPVGGIGNYISTGYHDGAWNGVGIVSSKVASVNTAHSNPHLYGVAYADASDPAVALDHFTPGTVVIEPVLVGDANLDGRVNFTDFLLLSSSFNQPNTSWDQGNFNYGSKTNFGDFLLLAANFNNSTSLDNAQLNSMDQFALDNGFTMKANPDGDGFALAAVPEPASVGIVSFLAVGLLARRRRNANQFSPQMARCVHR